MPTWLTIILLPALKVTVSFGLIFSAVAVGVLFTPEPSEPTAAFQPAFATADFIWSSVAARPEVMLLGFQALLVKPVTTPSLPFTAIGFVPPVVMMPSLPSIPTVPIPALPSLPLSVILSATFTDPFTPSIATAFLPSPAFTVPFVPSIATALPSLPAVIVPAIPSIVIALVGSAAPNVILSFNLLS